MITENLPPQVYELLSFLLPRGFVLIEELPDKHLAAFEFSRATDPPLIRVFDLPIGDKLQLAPDLIVDLPKRAVQITAKGKAALALREMQSTTEPPLKGKAKAAKKSGRKPKEDTPAKEIVLAVLRQLVRERGKDDPPPIQKDIKAACDGKVENVSRHIRKIFGSQKKFEQAWQREAVQLILAKHDYMPEGHSEYDDAR